jgi:uncharacterized alkaline shock family protein YloU
MSRAGHVIPGAGGAITIEPDALAGLVLAAVERVDGARVRRPRRGLDVAVENGTARIALELAARFGSVLPELARQVQANVAEAVSGSAGLAVAAVDVSIEELDG